MINKISPINNVANAIYVSKPSFKGNEKEKATEITTPASAQAITNLWNATINLSKKFDIEPLESKILNINNINDVEGERIYTSTGDLHSIVDEKEDSTTYYYPSEEDTNLIDRITIQDKKTQEITWQERSEVEDGKYERIDVTKFSAETGKEIANSVYKNNELSYKSITKYYDNGVEESIIHHIEDNTYYIDKENPNKRRNESIMYSNDFKNVDYSVEESKNNSSIARDAVFYNGALIRFNEYKYKYIPNLMEQDRIADKDLQPHDKIDLSKYTTEMEGKRTYYSNGTVETIKNDNVEILFSPKGFIKNIKTPEFELEAEWDGRQDITENITSNTKRITRYLPSGSISVEYENENTFKEICLDSKSKISSYIEGTIDSEGERKYTKELYYEKGMLSYAY